MPGKISVFIKSWYSVAWCAKEKDAQVAIIVQDRMMKIEVSSSSWWLIAGVKIDTGHLLKLPL